MRKSSPNGRSGRRRGRALLWGRVSDDSGHVIEATLETPEAYRLTVLTAMAAVENLLSRGTPPGFATPARAFGSQFVLSIPETDLQWGQTITSYGTILTYGLG